MSSINHIFTPDIYKVNLKWTSIPGVPTQPRGVLAYSSSPRSIDISWMRSEVTGPIDGFRVTYGSGPAADEFSIVVDANSDSVEIQELKPDSLYYMKLYAFNAAGRSSPETRSVQTLGEWTFFLKLHSIYLWVHLDVSAKLQKFKIIVL